MPSGQRCDTQGDRPDGCRQAGGGGDLMQEMVNELKGLNEPDLVGDAINSLEATLKKIHQGWMRVRGRKFASYGASSFSKMSSKEVWSVNERDMSMPSFKQSSLKDFGYKGSDDEL